jgi:5-methyltetrahydrofolate--homocysteine methyltransferase
MIEITPPPLPSDRESRTAALLAALADRVLVLDGATGTGLQDLDLTAEDFGGPDLEGLNEILNVSRPDAVDHLHEGYLAAGADIVETNSFGGTPLVLAEYGMADRAFELNEAAARLARIACARHDAPGALRFVCGSMGPTTKALSVTGGTTFAELEENFRVQALGLMAGGADYLLLETSQDLLNVKAGLLGAEAAFAEAGWRIPVAVSVTIETTGTMLGGQDAEALTAALLHADLLYLGLNCATGPDQMADHLRTISELARTRTACVPNAGLPDEDGCYHEGPEDFRRVFTRFLDEGWLNLVGGCCGSGPDHVRALKELVAGRRPRRVPDHHRALVSGLEAVELTDDNRPLFIGERTNVLGSRKFKKLIATGDYEAAAEVGRAQVKAGAQVLDLCLQDTERDEAADMTAFLERLVRLVKVPLMIDTTDAEVMERALRLCQGKAILNSINLEDGPERFDRVVPLARSYGAALVVGLIDEAGMAVTVERKMEVAERSYTLLTEEYGVPPEDIWWDALTFPCGTGDEAYLGAAGATVEAVRQLKKRFPVSFSTLGVSNVSFGLPPAGREVLNSVFLYECTKAGLATAIVNTERLARYAEIPENERKLAERLIFLDPGDVEGGLAAVAEFTAHFRGRKSADTGPKRETLPLPERISRAVVEGSRVGLLEDLDAALADPRWPTPLDIVNGPLMTGMDEVGRLFNLNQLIVAEVLQSAEVMKAAVSHLEPHMEKADAAGRGKLLLATVKGDVHDIGKNLVDIILTNNGYQVVNLGIKVPSERLIEAVREHRPDVIGLSGLLVKSAHQMVATAKDFAAAGIDTPLVVGGAALSRRFTNLKIAPAHGGFTVYASDAMSGLKIVDRLVSEEERPKLEAEVAEQCREDARAKPGGAAATGTEAPRRPRRVVRRDLPAPPPPDLDRHVEEIDPDDAWALLNPQMLYGKHLGIRGPVAKLKERGDEKVTKLEKLVEELMALGRQGAIRPHGVWRFFAARTEGDTLVLFDAETGAVAASFELPRQATGDLLCLTDYVLESDHVALFAVTAGVGVRERVEAYKSEGEYLKSHALAALALETAESAAEWLHRKLRGLWGFPDPADATLRDTLAARYRGKRYSFGYPACPDLAGQRQLFELLTPEEIGLTLTEGDMMDPEASVSALVFHHPDARYFRV